jgi:putative membrane protein
MLDIQAMQAALAAFVSGFPAYLLHVFVATVLVVASTTVYVLLSPYKEVELMRKGNGSAGLTFAGVILGLSIPMAASLASAHSLFDLAIWGIVALLMQLVAFRVVDLLLPNLAKRIENEEAGAAIVTVAVKIACGLILAAGMMEPTLRL